MLRAGGLSPAQTEKAASVIERAARRAAELTQQLLGFARKGKVPEHTGGPARHHRRGHLAFGPHPREEHHDRIHPGRYRPFVLGDPVQIQQVILNLSVNARDAMAGGGKLSFLTDRMTLPLRTDHEADDATGDFIKLVVADTGCGIPLEVQRASLSRSSPPRSRARVRAWALHGVWHRQESRRFICVSSDASSGTALKSSGRR